MVEPFLLCLLLILKTGKNRQKQAEKQVFDQILQKIIKILQAFLAFFKTKTGICLLFKTKTGRTYDDKSLTPKCTFLRKFKRVKYKFNPPN